VTNAKLKGFTYQKMIQEIEEHKAWERCWEQTMMDEVEQKQFQVGAYAEELRLAYEKAREDEAPREVVVSAFQKWQECERHLVEDIQKTYDTFRALNRKLVKKNTLNKEAYAWIWKGEGP
jgi:ClpP class serine protease